jgi:NhaP-type Na+/H+ or K+/H+ antiporter
MDLHGLTYWCSVSFLCIQLLFLSGILTVFFCGIVMSHYTWHNVTESSRVTTKYDLHFLSLGLFLMNIWNLFALCYLSTRYVDRFNWWLFLWGFEDYLLAIFNEFMLDSFPLDKTENMVSRNTMKHNENLCLSCINYLCG